MASSETRPAILTAEFCKNFYNGVGYLIYDEVPLIEVKKSFSAPNPPIWLPSEHRDRWGSFMETISPTQKRTYSNAIGAVNRAGDLWKIVVDPEDAETRMELFECMRNPLKYYLASTLQNRLHYVIARDFVDVGSVRDHEFTLKAARYLSTNTIDAVRVGLVGK